MEQENTPANPTSGSESRREGREGLERSREGSRELTRHTNPFSLMRRMSEDMDRLFSGFFGSGLGSWPSADLQGTFWPELEISKQNGKLVISADVPGMRKEDVKVEVRDGELCIYGERQSSQDKNQQGFYRSERSYGSFSRTVPLPEGAKADTASATFRDGVLRIELEAPEPESKTRQIEVRSSD